MMMVQPQASPLPGFNPDDLVGRTFLLPPGDNGERLRAKVTRKVVEDIEQADGERVQKLSFILGIGNGKLEEIISYNQLVDHLEAAANNDNEISDDLFKFRALIGHQGPLKPTDPNWKGINRKCTKTLSKAPCLVALRMSLTLHLLLFAQSM